MQQIINKIMKHFIYKTTYINGKYYIGRHSTNNEDDGYIGSGEWPLSIKDKSTLIREILEYAECEESLITLEGRYLKEHFGKPNCMNRTSDPIGFSSQHNPMKNPESVAKLSGENHWTKKYPERIEQFKIQQELRVKQGVHNFLGDNNPNKDGRNAKLAYDRGNHNSIKNNPSTVNSKNGTHHWQNGNSPNYEGKLNKKLIEEGSHNFLGPETNQKRIDEGTHNFLGSASNLKRLQEGRHPSQKKQTCEHCKKTVSIGMYKRWHGENCKRKDNG
jgi:hypothetical protein